MCVEFLEYFSAYFFLLCNLHFGPTAFTMLGQAHEGRLGKKEDVPSMKGKSNRDRKEEFSGQAMTCEWSSF